MAKTIKLSHALALKAVKQEIERQEVLRQELDAALTKTEKDLADALAYARANHQTQIDLADAALAELNAQLSELVADAGLVPSDVGEIDVKARTLISKAEVAAEVAAEAAVETK